MDLAATDVQVIMPHPFIPPLPPPEKPSKTKKVFPPAVLSGYTRVHGEVGSYSTSFLTYKSITKFLEIVEFFHDDHPDMVIIDSCSEEKCVSWALLQVRLLLCI